MRRLMKFLHTIGAIGLMGAMACLLVLLIAMPAPGAPASSAALHGAMGQIATWIFLPSMGLTLIAGLLAMALNRGFHNAGWAWVKLVTGVLVFEGSLVGFVGPLQEKAELSARALAGDVDAAALAATGSEQGPLWVLLAVATANVALGIWRPRLTNLRE
jgi:uncharacterized membrane protein